jgi:hypothetical protein
MSSLARQCLIDIVVVMLTGSMPPTNGSSSNTGRHATYVAVDAASVAIESLDRSDMLHALSRILNTHHEKLSSGEPGIVHSLHMVGRTADLMHSTLLITGFRCAGSSSSSSRATAWRALYLRSFHALAASHVVEHTCRLLTRLAELWDPATYQLRPAALRALQREGACWALPQRINAGSRRPGASVRRDQVPRRHSCTCARPGGRGIRRCCRDCVGPLLHGGAHAPAGLSPGRRRRQQAWLWRWPPLCAPAGE